MALVAERFDGQIASTGFSVLRANPETTGKFLFYYTQTDEFLNPLNELQRGTSYPAVRDKDIRDQPIPLPPLREQERIVERIESLFSRLDAGVAALKRAQAALKRYRASVLKAACEGRLVPQDPGDEPASELLERIRSEKGAKAGDLPEGLPDLPAGWRWAKMESIAETIGGITKGRNLIGKKTVFLPYLRVANVQRGFLDLEEMKEIELLESEIGKYLLKENDLLLTEGGDWDKLGRSCVWKSQVPHCVHQNHIFRARPYSDEISSNWIMAYTNSELGQKYFSNASKQTTNLASINLTQLRNCPVPIPPSSEQQRILTEVDRRISVVDQMELFNNVCIARAARLRQAILKRAFEGRLVEANEQQP